MWNRTGCTEWYWRCVCNLTDCPFLCMSVLSSIRTTTGQRSTTRGNGRYRDVKSLIQILTPSLAPSVFLLNRLPFKPQTFFSTVKNCALLYRAEFKKTFLTLPSHWVSAMRYIITWTAEDQSEGLLFKGKDYSSLFRHSSTLLSSSPIPFIPQVWLTLSHSTFMGT